MIIRFGWHQRSAREFRRVADPELPPSAPISGARWQVPWPKDRPQPAAVDPGVARTLRELRKRHSACCHREPAACPALQSPFPARSIWRANKLVDTVPGWTATTEAGEPTFSPTV